MIPVAENTGLASADLRSSKRARLVCFRCHQKKIRCDLVQQTDRELRPCGTCAHSGAQCQLRPSKRNPKSRLSVIVDQTHNEQAAVDNGGEFPLQAQNTTTVTSPETSVLRALPHDNAARGFAGVSSEAWPGSWESFTFDAGSRNADPSRLARDLQSPQLSSQPSNVKHPQHNQILSAGSTSSNYANADTISPGLQGAYSETFLEYAYVWCPVLERDDLIGQSEVIDSLLLRQAIALCGNSIKPPLIDHQDSMTYYNRAKELFYSDSESDPIVRLCALMLFFWWSAKPPNLINIDNAWWWTGITIRIAEESGLHREVQPHQPLRKGGIASLRRRIWWTLFARDRILSISQGRPTMIDVDFCDVEMVTVHDFPDPKDPRAEIFVQWVKLCEIGGRISKHLSKRFHGQDTTVHFTQDLMSWVKSLPGHIQLPFQTTRTTCFSRDVHRLYLTYLTIITILHLSKPSQSLPKATNAGIVAASCVARIFEDYLTRANLSFLSGEAGWEVSVAILALLHARHIESLRNHAEADIRILRAALKQMALHWPASRMFDCGFDKVLGSEQSTADLAHEHENDGWQSSETLEESSGLDWMDYFPFLTSQTTPLVNAILSQSMVMPFPDLDMQTDFHFDLQGFMSLPDENLFDVFNF